MSLCKKKKKKKTAQKEGDVRLVNTEKQTIQISEQSNDSRFGLNKWRSE